MKFACFGYFNEASFTELSKDEQESFIERCFAYDDELRRGGHFAGGHALKSASDSITVRHRSGKNIPTDGPFIESKEQIGGILMLEARDLNHAVALIAKHPGVKAGGFEIRPIDEEFTQRIEARGERLQEESDHTGAAK